MKIKVFALLLTVFALLFSLNVLAQTKVEIDVGDDFFVFSEDREKVEKITGQSAKEIDEYCKAQGIIYFAVNKENSKQIKIYSTKNKFSEQVDNLSLLSDEEIKEIIPSIIGDSEANSGVKSKDSQKFIYINEENLSDSGGEYSHTSYITVAEHIMYTLSFYTADGEDTEYIEEIYKTFGCSDFIKIDEKNNVAMIFGTVLLSLIAIGLIYTLIRDFKKDKQDSNKKDNYGG